MTSEIIVEFPSPLTDKEKKMIYGYKGEVVRCKDCKWHRTCEFYYALGNDRVPYETISECLKWHDDVPVDFYCAFGERRENGIT